MYNDINTQVPKYVNRVKQTMNKIFTLQPTKSIKDLSAKGYSKRPATNFTLSIRSTASSILAIGTSPDSTRNIRSSTNCSCLRPTITCRKWRHRSRKAVFTLYLLELKFSLYHVNSSINSRRNAVTIVWAMRIAKSVQSFPVRNHKTLPQNIASNISTCPTISFIN